MEMAKKK
ncbi:hypothetical protein A2U01_0068339, partial [Trifolium medium]|nr:hypothetical protein [Trifolium medium]